MSWLSSAPVSDSGNSIAWADIQQRLTGPRKLNQGRGLSGVELISFKTIFNRQSFPSLLGSRQFLSLSTFSRTLLRHVFHDLHSQSHLKRPGFLYCILQTRCTRMYYVLIYNLPHRLQLTKYKNRLRLTDLIKDKDEEEVKRKTNTGRLLVIYQNIMKASPSLSLLLYISNSTSTYIIAAAALNTGALGFKNDLYFSDNILLMSVDLWSPAHCHVMFIR